MYKLPLGRHENDIYLTNKPTWEYVRDMYAYRQLCLGDNGHRLLQLQINSFKTSRHLRKLDFNEHNLREFFKSSGTKKFSPFSEETVHLYWFNNNLWWRHWPMTNATIGL